MNMRLALAGTVALAALLAWATTSPKPAELRNVRTGVQHPIKKSAITPRATYQFILPDKTLTPGAVRTTSKSEICSHGTRELRLYNTDRRKARQREDHILERYGVLGALPIPVAGHTQNFQFDHLIPLGIGGADDDRNLWPQPYPDAKLKDKLEWRIRDLVCREGADVVTLQREIATNWGAAYKKYVGSE